MHASSAEIKGGELIDAPGRHVKHVDIKVEDKIEEKIARNIVLPTTGSSKSCLEIIEDEIGLVPTHTGSDSNKSSQN